MPFEWFRAGNLYHALDDLDLHCNRLFGVLGVSLPDKKLNVVADLKPPITFVSGYTCCGKDVFRSVFDRRDKSAGSLAVQFGNEAKFELLADERATRTTRPHVSRRASAWYRRTAVRGSFTGLYASCPGLVRLGIQLVLNELPRGQRLERGVNA